ncbi:MAG: fibrillarin-like rRNA/tRNA 2'-O-methyltransferase [Thaumarchaeota archaeon]|nr:fibrillarin-like rRNA/tRNA 2'-O-methyltransferase [Nitrososphaerota archaeon]
MEEDATNQTIIWVEVNHSKWLATLSFAPGLSVYDEKIVKRRNVEFRVWNPFRSKLAAASLKGLHHLPLQRGSSVLYLGVSTGTTASHISDIIGGEGVLYGVEFAPRVAREFVEKVAKHRSNVVPIVEDARHHEKYKAIVSNVDVVYADIAQPDQTEISIRNCRSYLKPDGDMLLIVKTPSIDVTRSPEEIVQSESNKLVANDFHILQSINLEPFDSAHWLIHAKMKV